MCRNLHHLCCDWGEGGQIILHQGAHALISLTETVTDELYLWTIRNIEIPAFPIVSIPIRRGGTCTSST